jgi:hypothetical protein
MNLEQLIHAEIIRADLWAVDAHFSSLGIADSTGLVHLKTAFVALANVADFEPLARSSYKTHPNPSKLFKEIKKDLEFAKYLRNKAVGHIHPQLISKAIEWQPILKRIPGRVKKSDGVLALNLWLLETTINTYVDAAGKHKIFDSETALMYPPNWNRFLKFLETTIRGSTAYLDSLVTFWTPRLVLPNQEPFDLDLALKAGKTNFKFLAQHT